MNLHRSWPHSYNGFKDNEVSSLSRFLTSFGMTARKVRLLGKTPSYQSFSAAC